MLLLILVHNKCITYIRHNQDQKSQSSAKTNDAEPALHFLAWNLCKFHII